jgi:RNA polymerase sigma-70 factor (ECF subfamily)
MDTDEIWREGTARWPEIEIDPELMARHLGRLSPEREGPAGPSERFLVAACIAGVPAALVAFDRDLIAQVPRFIARIDNSPAFGAEVAQLVREKLLLAPFARLREYSGAGPLAGWVRIVASRTALELKRRGHAEARRNVDLAREVARVPAFSEWELLRDKYRESVEAALREALAGLPAQDRMVLRLYVIGRKNIAEIGKVFGVHRATVARWIQAAESRIFSETVARLEGSAGISKAECESIARGLVSRLDISLEKLL